jgi:hypothetical protein
MAVPIMIVEIQKTALLFFRGGAIDILKTTPCSNFEANLYDFKFSSKR